MTNAKKKFAQNRGISKNPIFTVLQFPSTEDGGQGVKSNDKLEDLAPALIEVTLEGEEVVEDEEPISVRTSSFVFKSFC